MLVRALTVGQDLWQDQHLRHKSFLLLCGTQDRQKYVANREEYQTKDVKTITRNSYPNGSASMKQRPVSSNGKLIQLFRQLVVSLLPIVQVKIRGVRSCQANTLRPCVCFVQDVRIPHDGVLGLKPF